MAAVGSEQYFRKTSVIFSSLYTMLFNASLFFSLSLSLSLSLSVASELVSIDCG